jgi:hypothetical protein
MKNLNFVSGRFGFIYRFCFNFSSPSDLIKHSLIEISMWDEDALSTDDWMGGFCVDISELLQLPQGGSKEGWHKLLSKEQAFELKTTRLEEYKKLKKLKTGESSGRSSPPSIRSTSGMFSKSSNTPATTDTESSGVETILATPQESLAPAAPLVSSTPPEDFLEADHFASQVTVPEVKIRRDSIHLGDSSPSSSRPVSQENTASFSVLRSAQQPQSTASNVSANVLAASPALVAAGNTDNNSNTNSTITTFTSTTTTTTPDNPETMLNAPRESMVDTLARLGWQRAIIWLYFIMTLQQPKQYMILAVVVNVAVAILHFFQCTFLCSLALTASVAVWVWWISERIHFREPLWEKLLVASVVDYPRAFDLFQFCGQTLRAIAISLHFPLNKSITIIAVSCFGVLSLLGIILPGLVITLLLTNSLLLIPYLVHKYRFQLEPFVVSVLKKYE